MLSNAGDISICNSNPPIPDSPPFINAPSMRSESYLFWATFINGLPLTANFIVLFVLTVNLTKSTLQIPWTF